MGIQLFRINAASHLDQNGQPIEGVSLPQPVQRRALDHPENTPDLIIRNGLLLIEDDIIFQTYGIEHAIC